MPALTHTARIIILLVAVCALVVVLMFVTGWADDKAKRGSGGRVPVSTASPDSP